MTFWFLLLLLGTDGEAEPVIEEHVRVEARADPDDDPALFSVELDARELSRAGRDLSDLLTRVPGVSVRDYGGLGRYATMSLRASTAEQVVVLVDGVPQNRAGGGPVNLAAFPATQLERVTVHRGFAPAGAGLGGMGGVVDIRTRGAEDGTSGRIDALAGQLATARLSGHLNVPALGGDLRVGAEGLVSDGDFRWFDDNQTQANPADDAFRRRRNNDLAQRALFVRQRWDAASVTLRARDRSRGLPGIGTDTSETAILDERLLDLSAAWTGSGVEVRGGGFREDLDFEDEDGSLGAARRTELTGAHLSASTRSRIGAHEWLWRGEVRHERVSSSVRARRTLTSWIAEPRFRLGRVRVAPALRIEHIADRGREDVRLAGKVSALRVMSPRWAVKGSLGRARRNPSLLELFGDRGTVRGNADLRIEKENAAEVGVIWKGRAGKRHAEGVLFHREVEDLIWLVSTSPGTQTPRNVADATVSGLELWTAVDVGEALSLEASFTELRARDDSDDAFSHGEPLPFQPERTATASVSWHPEAWSVRWEVSYVGPYPIARFDDIPEVILPEKTLHDVRIGHRFRAGWELGLDVRNVFDRATIDVDRYPLPDRTIYVHAGVDFGEARR